MHSKDDCKHLLNVSLLVHSTRCAPATNDGILQKDNHKKWVSFFLYHGSMRSCSVLESFIAVGYASNSHNHDKSIYHNQKKPFITFAVVVLAFFDCFCLIFVTQTNTTSSYIPSRSFFSCTMFKDHGDLVAYISLSVLFSKQYQKRKRLEHTWVKKKEKRYMCIVHVICSRS